MIIIALSCLCIWLAFLLVPFRPWSTRERIEGTSDKPIPNLLEVTALVPARNEEAHIKNLVEKLAKSNLFKHIIVVNDESTDNTLNELKEVNSRSLTIVDGSTPPKGWVGKVWALHQGSVEIKTQFTLLIDADIEFNEATLHSIFNKTYCEKLQLTSVMALLKIESKWDELLIPAFIYFFKSLYPFNLSNNRKYQNIAGAAGGFILIKTSTLWNIGGFNSLKNALIDDCTLAKLVKKAGGNTWIGLSKGIKTKRSYNSLSNIWSMVERTAFTQLNYSIPMLFLCTFTMVLIFIAPVAGLIFFDDLIAAISAISILIMGFTYHPVLKYYELNALKSITLPLAGLLFLLMTWTSAVKYMVGRRSKWKGRVYKK